MFRHHSDLPLERDSASRFLPWITAIMVYLAALALAAAMIVDNAARAWGQDLTGTLTVQVPQDDGGNDATEARLAAALAVLAETPGVAQARPLPEDHVAGLLAPWLGDTHDLSGLPVPRLIDVSLEPDAELDADALLVRLRAVAGDIELADHRKWLQDLTTLTANLEYLSVFIVVLTGLAAVASVMFTARTGLAVHAPVIEVLHLIGARDGYIARQFQRQAVRLTLRGGVIGLVLSVVTILSIGRLLERPQAFGLPSASLDVTEWAIIAALPIAAALVASITTRRTIIRRLRKMP